MDSIPPTPEPASTCPAKGCGLPASQVTTRDLSETNHELTGSCKRGHLWTVRWFAAEVD